MIDLNVRPANETSTSSSPLGQIQVRAYCKAGTIDNKIILASGVGQILSLYSHPKTGTVDTKVSDTFPG